MTLQYLYKCDNPACFSAVLKPDEKLVANWLCYDPDGARQYFCSVGCMERTHRHQAHFDDARKADLMEVGL
jgi:hypothetical protein